MLHRKSLAVALCLGAVIAPVFSARAQEADKSGVSPSRLKLPKGPGSLEGTGENAEPNLSQGLATWGYPIAVPAGYEQATAAPAVECVCAEGNYITSQSSRGRRTAGGTAALGRLRGREQRGTT